MAVLDDVQSLVVVPHPSITKDCQDLVSCAADGPEARVYNIDLL